MPGDGAAVGLVTLSDESPILDVECRTYGEYAGDMTLAVDPPRKWWQAGPGEGYIGFTESKITKVLARGNRQVPEVSLRGVRPNRHASPRILTCSSPISPTACSCATGARRWSCPPSDTVDTFDECGNLFAAGIPVNLDRAITDGQAEERRRGDDGGVRARRRLRRRRRRPVGRPRLMATLSRRA